MEFRNDNSITEENQKGAETGNESENSAEQGHVPEIKQPDPSTATPAIPHEMPVRERHETGNAHIG